MSDTAITTFIAVLGIFLVMVKAWRITLVVLGAVLATTLYLGVQALITVVSGSTASTTSSEHTPDLPR